VDRGALERVLARAAELQLAGDPSDTQSELTEAQIVELGKEVGLAPEHLRQALAEERTRVALVAETGVASSLIGVGQVRASRTVSGNPSMIAAAIDAWMQREEGLRVRRHLGERTIWEPRRDFLSAINRAVNIGGRGYALMRAEEVCATVLSVGESRVLVTLDADLRPLRSMLAMQTGVASTLGVGGAAVLGVLGVMVPVAVVPAVAVPTVAMYAARQMQRRAATRAQLALEQLLDRLERGDVPGQTKLLDVLSAAAAAALPRRRL
jgi:hypothetical protein